MADVKITALPAATTLALTDIIPVVKSPGGAAATNKATLTVLSDSMVVLARYSTNAAQSIPNTTDTVVNFDTINYDTNSAVTTGAAWHFTAPVTGYYMVNACITFNTTNTWADGEPALLSTRINGAQISRLAFTQQGNANSIYKQLVGSDILYLTAGQTLDVTAYQGSGAALVLYNAYDYNYICIHKL